MKRFLNFIIVTSLLTFALSAYAIPVTYTLNNVTFSDGTAASGSFIFDAETYTGSSYDVSTTTGDLTSFEWTTANSSLYYGAGTGPNNFMLVSTLGTRLFNFSFLDAFTNAGGTNFINIDLSYECDNCSPFRRITSGSVTSHAIPEPVTLALILPVLGALAFRVRRLQQSRPVKLSAVA